MGRSSGTHEERQEPRVYADVVKSPDEVDAHSTSSPELTPLVMVADCLPVAMAGRGGVAMAHCGWRGLAGGIVARAVEAVDAEAAAIGPGIGPCCYEVGEEVLAEFDDLDGVAEGRMLDLPAVASRAAGARRGAGHRVRGPLHEVQPRALLLPPPRRRAHRPPGRPGLDGLTMVEPVTDLDVERVRANLARIREQAGPDVEILAATKYIRTEDMGALAEAGVELVGENRLQDLEEKRERWGDRFTWDFIGNLQSRKVKRILPLVRLIHSVASDSVLEQLGRHGGPDTEVLVEVNLSGEEEKGGIAPEALDGFIERCPVRVSGLMTMPPFTEDPEALAAVLRAPRASSPPSAACSGSRWARARIGRSRWRRGRRSCAWAPYFGHNRSTSAGGITSVKPNLSRDGDQGHMETRARVLRPR